MRSRLLATHFFDQFLETDLAGDTDRHQVLALVAAGLVTLPLFATVFMSVKYLSQPFQNLAWTQVTALTDRMIFCAASMLVSAIVATVEWDSLALSSRDAAILGVLPLSHLEIFRAKATALVAFVAASILAVNALPAMLHPTVMVANLAVNPVMVLPLIAARGLSTMAAGVFGFACVLGIREGLYLVLGRRSFERVSDIVRSVLLFALLLFLLLVPARLSSGNDWVFERQGGPVLERPVAWFAAIDTVIAARALKDSQPLYLSTLNAEEDARLAAQYRHGLPRVVRRAAFGAAALVVVLVFSSAMYLWNARRLRVLDGERSGAASLPLATFTDILARAVARGPAKRAGLLFLIQTTLGSPIHRTYLIAAGACGIALLIGMAPDGTGGTFEAPRTAQVAAQTLLLTAMIAGFRAALRKSANARATWLFGVAETGTISAFRDGVRAGVLTVVAVTVLALLPLHAAAWGVRTATMHAVVGAVLGWLIVEIACGDVEQPLVRTIPPNDALNTIGTVFLGAIVIGVFILARIERAVLTHGAAAVGLAFAIGSLAMWVRRVHERDHRAAAVALLPPPDRYSSLA
jgi:hypothetical protein